MLLVGAVCGTVFWHRISDQIQYLLIFNLLWIPSFIFLGVLHLFSSYVLDVQIDTDEFFGYWILSAQCVVLCIGIMKYKKKMENVKPSLFFLILGKMAKADGQVLRDEIAVVEAFMVSAEFDQDTRKKAFVFFNAGETTTRPFYEIAAEFAQCDIEDLHAILEWFLELVFADGVLHAIEEQYLYDAVTAFGLSPDILTQALKEKEILSDIEKYYATLGCVPSASNDELKRRYRHLSKQYHPDRIFSKDLPPYLHKFAKEKFQNIQNAYEAITEHRK